MAIDSPPGSGLNLGAHRAVAQSGSALDWGSRGRGFKSRRPDHNYLILLVFFDRFGPW